VVPYGSGAFEVRMVRVIEKTLITTEARRRGEENSKCQSLKFKSIPKLKCLLFEIRSFGIDSSFGF
jgi:hypothetical protein